MAETLDQLSAPSAPHPTKGPWFITSHPLDRPHFRFHEPTYVGMSTVYYVCMYIHTFPPAASNSSNHLPKPLPCCSTIQSDAIRINYPTFLFCLELDVVVLRLEGGRPPLRRLPFLAAHWPMAQQSQLASSCAVAPTLHLPLPKPTVLTCLWQLELLLEDLPPYSRHVSIFLRGSFTNPGPTGTRGRSEPPYRGARGLPSWETSTNTRTEVGA
ncbi:hypothetical protein QBC41DRAFT_24884 [Cercophora samala]|uniref:Uncharacterized protein n=1 Tax=Cercophora samala TaxID=330535 RepID=A0AA39ZJV9_9PEZI|nr:hypothetical protein QBC41DRAFT_24884 [Cercophora samala]